MGVVADGDARVFSQYPLKEVVVIHQDPEALKDIQSLQKYILEVSDVSGSIYLENSALTPRLVRYPCDRDVTSLFFGHAV